MPYFMDAGPTSGPILWRDRYAAIGVLQARDNHTPIGTALATGQDEDDRAHWSLTVHGIPVPGLWVVVDRESRPAR